MPNHVTTVCMVVGSSWTIERFVETHIKNRVDDDGKPYQEFDFNTITPTPESIRATEVDICAANPRFYDADLLHVAWALRVPHNAPITDEHTRNYFEGAFTTAGEILQFYERVNPNVIEAGHRAVRAHDATGYMGWYEWNMANWGTKWNSFNFVERYRNDVSLTFEFQTALQFPKRIFEKLAKMYPDAVFSVSVLGEFTEFAYRGVFKEWGSDFKKVDVTDDIFKFIRGKSRNASAKDCLIGLIEKAEEIFASAPDLETNLDFGEPGYTDIWSYKFDRIFDIAPDIRDAADALGLDIDYCDPDTTYEEDVTAFMNAIRALRKNLQDKEST